MTNTSENEKDKHQIIGFAGIYYTLWEYFHQPFYDYKGVLEGYGKKYIFIKNISKSETRTKDRYPDLEIDLSLKGTHTIVRMDHQQSYPDDVFDFGKYRGTRILDCKDIRYLDWAYDILSDERKVYAREILKKEGFHFIDDIKYDENEWKIWQQNNDFKDTIRKGDPFSLVFEHSLSEDGTYFYRGLYLEFEDIVPRDYKGYNFALPRQNGKAKRIKRKEMEIKKYVLEDNNTIIVKEFNLIN